jgi:hypothetical protein
MRFLILTSLCFAIMGFSNLRAQDGGTFPEDIQQTVDQLNSAVMSMFGDEEQGETGGSATASNAARAAAQAATAGQPSAQQAQAQEEPVATLVQAYEVLNHHMFSDAHDDDMRALRDFCDNFEFECNFLSTFWRVQAQKECLAYSSHLIEDMVAVARSSGQERYFYNLIEHCSYGYYYEHRDDVFASVEQALSNARQREKDNKNK